MATEDWADEREKSRIRAEAVSYVSERLLPHMAEHSGAAIIREAGPIADFILKGETDDQPPA